MRFPRSEWTLTPIPVPAVGYSGAGFFVAGFSVLWRVLGMASYQAYVYCDKCNQPLRKNEYRHEFSGVGQSVSVECYCRICNSIVRKPFNVAVWTSVVLLTFLTALVIAEMLSELNNTVSDSGNKPLFVFAVVALPLGYSGYGLWKNTKCKPIYDRWVMQHGTDPDKWPAPPKFE